VQCERREREQQQGEQDEQALRLNCSTHIDKHRLVLGPIYDKVRVVLGRNKKKKGGWGEWYTPSHWEKSLELTFKKLYL